MSLVSKTIKSSNKWVGIASRMLFVVLLCVMLYGLILVYLRLQAPDVVYSRGQADCSDLTNEHCVIKATATNPTDSVIKLVYVDTGGPGYAIKHRAKIYAQDGRFCHADVERGSGYVEILPQQSMELTWKCILDIKHDETVGSRPAYILIDYHGKKDRIDLVAAK